jgi:hypothetical protein
LPALNPRQQRYNTHKSGFYTKILYKYHPLYGKEIWIKHIYELGAQTIARIESPEAPVFLSRVIYEWFIDPCSCSRVVNQEPVVSITALKALRDLLDAQHFHIDAVSSTPSPGNRGQRREDAKTTQARAGREPHLGTDDGGCEGGVHDAAESPDEQAVDRNERSVK